MIKLGYVLLALLFALLILNLAVVNNLHDSWFNYAGVIVCALAMTACGWSLGVRHTLRRYQ